MAARCITRWKPLSLLDQTLWEFAARLPFSLRLRGGELKAVLREIVRRQVVRSRLAAQTAASRCGRALARDPLEAQLESMLDAPLLQREGWIRPGALEPLIRSSLARQYAPVQLWYLLVFRKLVAAQSRDGLARPAPALC